MKEYIPSVGDGVVAFGSHYIVRQYVFKGGKLTGVWVDGSNGARIPIPLFALRRETFMEYVGRPTGFGKTPRLAAHIIHLFSLCVMAGLLLTGLYWWAPLGLIPAGALWFGSWMNYTRRWV